MTVYLRKQMSQRRGVLKLYKPANGNEKVDWGKFLFACLKALK